MKVSKKNFVPPPKVESSVVRIEPKHPLPNINFIEWDGLLRICFSRKNKTLGAIFKQKKILDMIYNNVNKIKMLNNNNDKNNNSDINNNNLPENFGMELDEEKNNNKEDENEEEDDDIIIDKEENNNNDNDKKDNIKKKDEKKEEFKLFLMEILTKNNFTNQRAIKMNIDDFLKLLNLFNNKGIHFN
jgi:18S rRNA (adenine1779-N6/adenine1780-N6)-dimethyltransferase